MSVRLLRESSDTPNITNRDDTHMTRYAYGNISGIVKDFGDELSYNASNSKFSLNSGRAVIQGWEVEIEPGSWVLDLSTVTGSQYYLIYLEINIAVETAEIKSAYLPGTIPSVELGDDLTKYPQGIARLPLYTFRYTSGTFSDIVKVVKAIPYSGQRLDAIEDRLDKLGFKEGSVASTIADTSLIAKNFLKRQGNYVLGEYAFSISPYITLDELFLVTNFGVVPEQFRPLSDVVDTPVILSGICGMFSASGNELGVSGYFSGYAKISRETGIISWSTPPKVLVEGAVHTVTIFDTFYMRFGYEAGPLT